MNLTVNFNDKRKLMTIKIYNKAIYNMLASEFKISVFSVPQHFPDDLFFLG